MPALDGPVLFRTIAGAPRDPLLSAAPKPERVFPGAVGFARCLDGFARGSRRGNWILSSAWAPDAKGD